MNCYTIYFRVDSSTLIGTGHLMRCLTLADALSKKGAEVSFICRELAGNLCHIIEEKGYKVYRLPYSTTHDTYQQTADYAQLLGVTWEIDAKQTMAILKRENCPIDWLIIDHYGLDKRWETSVRPLVKKIMVIDDLANRHHDCDLLLDQNLHENMEKLYEGLVPDHCQKLLGPQYALLRQEFKEARKHLRQRDGSVKRILIFFGGSDPTNETSKALYALYLLNRPDIAIDVVIGAANPHKEQIKQLCATMPNTNSYCQVENITQLMNSADLAIGGGGTTTWERCFLGLPSITLVIAHNQAEITQAVAMAGATWNVGWHADVFAESLANTTKKIIDTPSLIKRMEKTALQLMVDKASKKEDPVVTAIIEDLYAKT